jgi:NADPH:quinone reductase-like Zn-dependent oxidoreductase
MRAVVHDRYGPPDVLRLEEVERPVPKDDEVLVKIHATTVNRTDSGLRSAEYFISRFVTGLLRPNRRILGSELAGEVEAVGPAVTEFAVGDRVFGVSADKFGTHAEFICLRESAPLAHMPTGMTFEEAAASDSFGRTRSWRCGRRGSGTRRCCSPYRGTRRRTSSS